MDPSSVRRAARVALAAAAALASALGCGRCAGGGASAPIARFDGGEITEDELHREAAKLPPILRARTETPNGRRDFASAIVDRRLLAQEARRRGLHEDPRIRAEVADLEERLAMQALLVDEERRGTGPSEAELRAFYAASQEELRQPARVRLRRILIGLTAGAAPPERARARARAERLEARLRGGEPFERVAADGDGPERQRGGDLGLIAEHEGRSPLLEQAAFALGGQGSRSAIVPTEDGLALLEVVERRPAHVPSFEEARGDVANRMTPQRKRKVFDELLARLRAEADVSIALPAGPR